MNPAAHAPAATARSTSRNAGMTPERPRATIVSTHWFRTIEVVVGPLKSSNRADVRGAGRSLISSHGISSTDDKLADPYPRGVFFGGRGKNALVRATYSAYPSLDEVSFFSTSVTPDTRSNRTEIVAGPTNDHQPPAASAMIQ